MRRAAAALVFPCTVASAAAALLSIAAAQILLVLAVLLWIVARPGRPHFPFHLVPLLALLVTTALSLAESPDPAVGFGVIYKFWLLLMGLLVANMVTSPDRARIFYRALIAAGATAALIAIVQFGVNYLRFQETGRLEDDPMVLARITGPLGHWMTFSGGQLLVWCAAVPAIVAIGQRWLAPALVIGVAIVLSFTRSIWLGSAAAFGATVFMVPPRLMLKLLIPMLVVVVASSGLIYHRIAMSFDAGFAPDYSRLVYLDVGIRMIKDHPILGVGPNRVGEEFPRYYSRDDLNTFYYGHLHNNFIQIAAERGLLSLACVLWFFVALYRNFVLMLKSAGQSRWIPQTAIAALTGFLVAGLFEFNFGDSEVFMLLLAIVSAPFGVLRRDGHAVPSAVGSGVLPAGMC